MQSCCRLCFQHIIPGIKALGLTYTYAEKVFGFIIYRDYLPHNHGCGGWLFSAVAAVNNIGLSGASPGVLKGMPARQISDLYGLDAEQTEGLRTLLQKTQAHSNPLGLATNFFACVLGRFRFHIRWKMPWIRFQLRVMPKRISFFLAFLGFSLAYSSLVLALLRFTIWLPWSRDQSTLFFLAALVLASLGIRPTLHYISRTRYGKNLFVWCKVPR